jgi:hypothetical protein
MRGQLILARDYRPRNPRPIHFIHNRTNRDPRPFKHQAALPPPGQLDIHLGKQPAVQQRIMCGACREIDRKPPAQSVQAIRQSRKLRLRHFQRIHHPADVERRQSEHFKFSVEEREVERRVVRDQHLVGAKEPQQLPRDLPEQRFAGQMSVRKTVDPRGILGHVAAGIDQAMKLPPGWQIIS